MVLILIPFLYFIVYSAYRLILYTGVCQRCRCCQRLRCLKRDAENNDYVLPYRLDDPSDYTDVPSTREKELSGPENNQLQYVVQSVSDYGSYTVNPVDTDLIHVVLYEMCSLLVSVQSESSTLFHYDLASISPRFQYLLNL